MKASPFNILLFIIDILCKCVSEPVLAKLKLCFQHYVQECTTQSLIAGFTYPQPPTIFSPPKKINFSFTSMFLFQTIHFMPFQIHLPNLTYLKIFRNCNFSIKILEQSCRFCPFPMLHIYCIFF